jgi:hypothetical protein
VARGDRAAVAAHVDALAPYPDAQDLYLHLTHAMEALVASEPAAIDSASQVA